MKSILTELYEGRIFPAEQYSPRSEEYRKIHQEHYQHYDDFIETLSKVNPPLDKRFIEIMDEQLDVIPYEFSEMFIDGFRLGARIMIDIFQGDLGIRENEPSGYHRASLFCFLLSARFCSFNSCSLCFSICTISDTFSFPRTAFTHS